MSDIKSITYPEFASEVLNVPGVTLVDFWAPWCGPCKQLEPVLERFADEFEGTLKIVKVNLDEETQLSIDLAISQVPTLLFYQDGVVQQSVIGAPTSRKLRKYILEHTE